ncbi:DNA-3-methyladenine glycosylase I [Komagataeibacter intermedius]|uniref:DNA-3-methyladenine glycosylase n=2 Tax=Komagataeibacter intermedius TaxID=66229 RepID=A0A0N1F724_9PROT|nr:DNA-3-methyladenine glycosylase I [Komagataeibacter intermedius]KPH85430.1 DNA-3-methyladenine glycosylase [Komagataeibacter intermedius AF2]MCF3637834.1 DNA-3-methyladenine glycosylase I [Komagataeibacter intermedius]GAN88206.1 DNA-3-methyladenine glycosylase I [Komagataeibacter intermedius TF2]GBQ77675.1 DNA-3-methyladenine glycosylase I [Komagataeibacter intermedius NRIC 0521]
MTSDERIRCHWARTDALLQAYHDTEWGVPEHDSRALWEKLMLDGFQAGLSWRLILSRREAFREAFAGFRPEIVAGYGEKEVGQLLANQGIIRSQAKIRAVIRNARAYLAMREAGEDFAGFVWDSVQGKPVMGDGAGTATRSIAGNELSASLKKRGFSFVGPVIVHAWMQAGGLINDHETECFCRTRGK